MARLADYFLVVGYDHEKDRSGGSSGKIIQRFPEKDWEDCPFTQGIELFCQPTGWSLSPQRLPPTYFVAVLTDIDADRHYCACMTFYEDVAIMPLKPDEDMDEHDMAIVHHSKMFAPKTLALVSRLDYFETFRNCLGIMYTVYIENLQVQLETLIGNMMGCVQVPPQGGPQVRYSIGAGDRQALQPPLSPMVPATNTAVATLFDQLGIQNVLTLFCAALTDHKILFFSQSFSRLTDSCHALTALVYPLKYSYVYIPILPVSLLEVLNAPTPFLAGVHYSLREEVADLLDVIVVDLDGGSLKLPEHVTVPSIPEPIVSRTKDSLTQILAPDLLLADHAFPLQPKKISSLLQRDKEIRAVFIRMFAELFQGYRSCLTIIRIHPEPYITFHKMKWLNTVKSAIAHANFLGHRGLVDDEFTLRVLDGMGFLSFVSDRGPPYRVCDIFDEVYATMQEHLIEESQHPEKTMEHIKDIAHQLYINEFPNPQPYVQKVPKPTEGSYSRIHQPPFPKLNLRIIQDIVDEGLAKHSIKNKLSNVRPHQPRNVPMGPPISTVSDRNRIVDNNARRLEVLRNCINFIFENKISDARIIFPAVLRALKSRIARLSLVEELAFHVQSNRAMLEHQQFDLVVRLLNCALQNDSSMDENGVAYAVLPLATSFCRKLCTGVIQFAYTCVQDHAVWANNQFWEAAFYQDVQKQIKQLYKPTFEDNVNGNNVREKALTPTAPKALSPSWNRASSTTPDMKRREVPKIVPKEISALEIAAEQLRVWPSLDEEQKQDMISNEESTVYSQAIHYANRMVYMKVPLDVNKSLANTTGISDDNSNSNITVSLAESDSYDAESGFDETESSDVGSSVIKFVTRFVDKVCSDSGVQSEHLKNLHQMIPGVIAMHIETLEGVHRESKRLPPIQKPKILTPTLLPGEDIVMEGLRVYLLPDGREEGVGGMSGGPSFIPAEGAIFLTTYRIIFKGTPVDQLACENVIVRAFPVSTLTKEKKISVQYLQHLDQWLQEVIQLRSNVFQLLKIAFDDEVGSENVETFRKLVNKIRNPPSVFQSFAFTGYTTLQPTPLHKHKDKNASLKQFAKKTLMKTARKAGLKSKQSSRKQKYVLPTPPMQRKSLSPARSSDSESERPNSELYDDLSLIDENEFSTSLTSDPKNLEKLMERPGYQDYLRQGLGRLPSSTQRSRTEPFRISVANASFSLCRSYPALVVVPQSVSDDSLRKFARTNRQYRFPVITWRHPRTKALLLRASGFHSRSPMGMLKHQTSSSHSTGETSSSLEQEKYFSAIVGATPNSNRSHTASYSDSLTSLDSLMMAGTSDTLTIPETPDSLRRNVQSVADRNSSKPKFLTIPRKPKRGWQTLSRIGSLRDKPSRPASSGASTMNPHLKSGSDTRGDLINNSVQRLQKGSLYVLGDKAQMKAIKVEAFPKCDFIPVDYYEVRHVKASFKKLMRACVPSTLPVNSDSSFHKNVEDSDWLQQVQNILQLAGATVDLIDVQGSSVMICLEDGWDITTQIVSTAQVLLDPYYRTIEGFKSLIEKEWLSFGHRFTHRSNQTAANQASGFAPIFLQFLDIVHQIHHQFPLSFEFNQFYLKFLAYHYVSCRFKTFMLDSEVERMDAGWLLDEKRFSRAEGDELPGFSPKHSSNQGQSIWEYIEKYHRKSPVFYNFMYSPLDQDVVLRPYSNLSNLRIWEYYLTEDLAHGPSYDFEIVNKELKQNEGQEAIEGINYLRKCVNGCYDNIVFQQPDTLTLQFQECHKLETDLGHLPLKWKVMWDKFESPNREALHRQISFNTQLVRSHGRSIHKRSTLEILVRGKLLGEAAKMFSQPHRFEKHNYTTPAYCDYCNNILWGLVKTGMHCTDCGYNCHEKCMPHVPKNCTRLKPVADSSASNSSISRAGGSEASSVSGGGTLTSTSAIYDHHSGEHRTHEGYLYKRGALLKGWKQRWFVLDSMKHQLRYYDAMEDSNCKGYVDLTDVVSVTPIKNVQGAPKKADENAFFELKTLRRQYNFLALDGKTAQDWVDKIQSCI